MITTADGMRGIRNRAEAAFDGNVCQSIHDAKIACKAVPVLCDKVESLISQVALCYVLLNRAYDRLPNNGSKLELAIEALLDNSENSPEQEDALAFFCAIARQVEIEEGLKSND